MGKKEKKKKKKEEEEEEEEKRDKEGKTKEERRRNELVSEYTEKRNAWITTKNASQSNAIYYLHYVAQRRGHHPLHAQGIPIEQTWRYDQNAFWSNIFCDARKSLGVVGCAFECVCGCVRS